MTVLHPVLRGHARTLHLADIANQELGRNARLAVLNVGVLALLRAVLANPDEKREGRYATTLRIRVLSVAPALCAELLGLAHRAANLGKGVCCWAS